MHTKYSLILSHSVTVGESYHISHFHISAARRPHKKKTLLSQISIRILTCRVHSYIKHFRHTMSIAVSTATVCLLVALLANVGHATDADYSATSTTVPDNSFLVQTPVGPIRGKTLKTLLAAKPYHAFKGIPYAEAPVGNKRFRVSVGVGWAGLGSGPGGGRCGLALPCTTWQNHFESI